ncbi:MAG: hypothetical protein ACPLN0_07510 [Candidatus Hydrothermia bacterium]
MTTGFILSLLFAYQPPVPQEILFENLIKKGIDGYYNVRFSIPVIPLAFENIQIKRINSSLLLVNTEYFRDSAGTFDFYPRFFYRKQNYGIVIEPQFRLGKVRGWPNVKWQNVVCGAYSRAYFYYEFPKLSVMAGRNKIQLNLEGLLAEEDPPIDGVLALYRGKRFNFGFFTGQLDSRVPKDTTIFYEVGKLYNRYISGHSLEYRLDNFTASFSEVAIYYSQTNMPDWYFLNPFMLYHPRILDAREGGEHNVFWILAANYWGAKFSSHLEFLVDDFHLPDPNQWAPHKFAWIFKFFVLDFPFRRSFSGFYYTGATRWTYTHGLSLLYFNNRGEVMGSLNENDFDRVEVFVRKHLGENLDARIALWFKRKGEANTDEKDIYWDYSVSHSDYPREFFLTRVVEKRLGFGLGVDYNERTIGFRGKFEYDLIWNKDHNRGNKGTELRLILFGTARVF